MTKEFATAFAQRWVESWNAHDLEKTLSFYSEDFIIETPMALLLYPQSGGTVVGKSEVSKYWAIGLKKNPHLRFELLDVLVGVNSLGIHLFNASSNKKSIELMCFNSDMKVHKSIAIYAE
ncbi:nuclear transport factor 2 family protein [Spirosoma radiotolerans]|uniref:CbbQ/NirQ/NorQ/GpvN family protein n=1 Tax=Spirosoma radiotolerans TaxID=1379870 RepID=A0A0E3V5Q6_9BACT|nr:nuclear transport factor 2 family protein [Spirosoma radiotolerans]AKD53851.1 CbbQ/NirQ/NorQ/GpvN family protein [Spirosoma radiotolerans]